MNITIRKATKEDIPALLNLIKELALYEKAPEEVTVTESHFLEAGFGSNPVWWSLVAVDEHNEIVGMALYYIRYSTWKGKSIYLEDIIVTNTHRNKGIGSMLMEDLIATAKKENYNRISWQVLDWNLPAINFYKKYNTKFDDEWINCSINV